MSSEHHEIKEIKLANAILLPQVSELLSKGHTVTLRLKGFSMRPFLEDNRDKALLGKPVDIKENDAVLAEIHPKTFVLHRLIKIEGDYITLRGDGNLRCEYCKLEDIKGKVIAFYRKGRKKADLTDGNKWKLYSKIWCRLYPVRRYLLAFYKRIWIPLFGTI
jgi:hypothetical protein